MKFKVCWLLPALVLATACGAGAHYGEMPSAQYASSMDKADGPGMAGLAMRGEADGLKRSRVAGEVGGEPAGMARKVIYTARYTVDVFEVKVAQKALISFVQEQGGYLQQLTGNTVVLRIPAEKFETVEPRLDQLGRVDEALTDVRAQDVTEEYLDAELRLKTKKNYLESLYKLLDSAGKLKDKLAVQQEIARVVEEIERLEGRLRYLAQQVGLATVTVTFRLAHSGPKRTFRLPWEWLEDLGVEYLIN